MNLDRFRLLHTDQTHLIFLPHDTDDGNIQYRDTKPIEEYADTDELNDVLNKVATETSGRKVTHKLKTRPDRWEGQQGSCTRENRPYLSYQKIRWADYHRKNPSKGSTGHVTHKQFAKQVANECIDCLV